jgi:radical SAM superfamily enzyme YgiQ (UPF0313 family)
VKVLLVYPPSVPGVIGAGVFYITEPLGLEMIAAPLQGRHEVRILDLRLEDDLAGVLERFQPDLVGVTALTVEVYRAQAVLQTVRRVCPGAVTIVGGQHATAKPDDFDRPSVDLVCLGEGVETLAEVAEVLGARGDFRSVPGLAVRRDGGLEQTAPRPPVRDLDRLPLPARHLTASYRSGYFRGTWRPYASMMTSRGCPFRCRFCAVWKTEAGGYRVRSPGAVLRELRTIAEPHVSISDDNFLHNTRRAEEICDRVLAEGIEKTFKLVGRADTIVRRPDLVEKWRRAGMEIMLVGFEGFRDEDLRSLNKRTSAAQNRSAIRILHDQGVTISAHFIVDPDFDEEDFEALGDFVEEMELRQPVFCILTPLPGTDLYEETSHLLTTENYEMFDLSHSVLPTRLPLDRFYESYMNLYRRAYLGEGGPRPGSFMSEELMGRVMEEFRRGARSSSA